MARARRRGARTRAARRYVPSASPTRSGSSTPSAASTCSAKPPGTIVGSAKRSQVDSCPARQRSHSPHGRWWISATRAPSARARPPRARAPCPRARRRSSPRRSRRARTRARVIGSAGAGASREPGLSLCVEHDRTHGRIVGIPSPSDDAAAAIRAARARLLVAARVLDLVRVRARDGLRRCRLAGLRHRAEPVPPRPRRPGRVPAAVALRPAGRGDLRPLLAQARLHRLAPRRCGDHGCSCCSSASAVPSRCGRFSRSRSRAEARPRSATPRSARCGPRSSRCGCSRARLRFARPSSRRPSSTGPAIGGLIFAIDPEAVYAIGALLMLAAAALTCRSSRV